MPSQNGEPPIQNVQLPSQNGEPSEFSDGGQAATLPPPEAGTESAPVHVAAKAKYFAVNADGVNIRSGPSTDYKVLGSTQKDALLPLDGVQNGWCKTLYRGRTAYVYFDYCTPIDMDICADERIERVILEGCKLLGTPYVYGAVRYMDGSGKRLAAFNGEEFDCSSLMQYIFKLGADVNLQMTTRTQIYQGRAVEWENIERGDLLFFTNAARKNMTGVERVGHVALYLGDGYILHTASDFCKIEKISAARRANFLQARRVV